MRGCVFKLPQENSRRIVKHLGGGGIEMSMWTWIGIGILIFVILVILTKGKLLQVIGDVLGGLVDLLD